MTLTKLQDFVGKSFEFYGAHSNRFQLGDVVYEAVEDEQDGYRSCLQEVRESNDYSGFFDQPLAQVTGRVGDVANIKHRYEDKDTIEFVDSIGHVWLEVGTIDVNDYYPCFCFNYCPKVT